MKHPGESFDTRHVSRETRERLSNFIDLLLRWQTRINLIGRAASSAEAIIKRHVEDSVQLALYVDGKPSRGIDIGSGAGFPGLVLSIVTGIGFDLIEADRRKAAFLQEAARITEAPVIVHPNRAESRPCGSAPLITARAVAPLKKLLQLVQPYLQDDTVCLFSKGAKVEIELADAIPAWRMHVLRFPSNSHDDGVILKLSKIHRAEN